MCAHESGVRPFRVSGWLGVGFPKLLSKALKDPLAQRPKIFSRHSKLLAEDVLINFQHVLPREFSVPFGQFGENLAHQACSGSVHILNHIAAHARKAGGRAGSG